MGEGGGGGKNDLHTTDIPQAWPHMASVASQVTFKERWTLIGKFVCIIYMYKVKAMSP